MDPHDLIGQLERLLERDREEQVGRQFPVTLESVILRGGEGSGDPQVVLGYRATSFDEARQLLDSPWGIVSLEAWAGNWIYITRSCQDGLCVERVPRYPPIGLPDVVHWSQKVTGKWPEALSEAEHVRSLEFLKGVQ